MKKFLVLLFLSLGAALSSPRMKREEACDEVVTNYEACIASAQIEFSESLKEEGDRPDLYSRKSCNFIEAAVLTCGGLLAGDCYTKEAVEERKNLQFQTIVDQLEQAEEWDSSKCPSVKEWKDSQGADDAGEELGEGADEEGGNEVQEGEGEEEGAKESVIEEGEKGEEGEEEDGGDAEHTEEGGEDVTDEDDAEDGVVAVTLCLPLLLSLPLLHSSISS